MFQSLHHHLRYLGVSTARAVRPTSHKIRSRSWWARVVSSLVLLVSLFITPQTSLAAGDPTWGSLGFTDITGHTLQVMLAYTDKQGTPQDLNVARIPAALVPAQVQQLLKNPVLSTPLSQLFAQRWNQTKDSSGQTMEQLTCATIKNTLVDEVRHQLNQSADLDSCNLAASGELAARVQDGTLTRQEPPGWHYASPFYLVPGGQNVMLSYWLPNNSVTFTVHAPLDPQFTLTFDAELQIVADMADNYPATCTDAVYGWSEAHNASLSAANDVAKVYEGLGSLAAFVQGEPTALFQSTEGQIDQTIEGIGPIAPLTTAFDEFKAACDGGRAYGFNAFNAAIQGGTLAFTFEHPDLSKPQLTNLAAQHNGGSFLNQVIGTAQLQVHDGDSVAVNGYFDIPQVTTLWIGWTPASTVADANVRWGEHGKPLTTVTQAGGEFDASGLTPNTRYDFQVQDCDQVSCSPWSNVLSATTGGAGSDNVQLKLMTPNGRCRPPSACPVVGTTAVAADGTVSTTISVPAGLKAGAYTLQAQVGSGANRQTATTPLTVLASSQAAQPLLAVWDTIANRALASPTRTVQGLAFTLHGESFAPGTVTVRLDSASGPVLGTATAGSDGSFQGSFTMDYSATSGAHTLVANQGATLAITVEFAPQ